MPREKKPLDLRPSVEILESADEESEESVVLLEAPESKSKSTPEKGGKFTIEDFEIGRLLGNGAYGYVFLARTKTGHFLCAIKVLPKSEILEREDEYLLAREIEIQSHLHHPNVVRLYTYFWDETNVYLVMEYAPGGELYKAQDRVYRFPEYLAAKYIFEIADALEYCHGKHVIHRDIKPENLLLGVDGEVKIADFGLSVHAPSNKRTTRCGTMDYQSPELLSHLPYGTSVDIWTIGVLLFEFLVGCPPFERDTEEDTHEAIKSVDYTFPIGISEGAKDLISRLLRREPVERLTLREVKKHYWIEEMKKKRERMV